MDVTANLNLPIPNADAIPPTNISDEFPRIALALTMLDAIIYTLQGVVAGKAEEDHTQAISTINGLTEELASKMSASTTFSLDDLEDVLGAAGAAVNYVLVKNIDGKWVPSTALAALGLHDHAISEVVGLGEALVAIEDALSQLAADKVDVTAAAATEAAIAAAISLRAKGLFVKADSASVAFTKTGAGTASIKAGTIVEVNGAVFTFAVATAITMPALTAGTDYAIWVHPDGAISATASFTSAPVANARRIGGFHYAPGGNAAAQAGGDAVPAINEFSMWDLKWRPSCPDPRGMTLVAGAFWCDIYHLGVDHLINGTSKFNVTMADGSSPPRRPLMFGGNGTATYSTLTRWEAAEVMASHGKELLSYADFAAAAYGTTENASAGTDPVSTILRQAYTSKWGVMLSTGNVWIWGNEFGGGAAGAAWASTNGGRGQVYQQENALLLGGDWGHAAFSGSRASSWNSAPSNSAASFGARGRCEHLTLV